MSAPSKNSIELLKDFIVKYDEYLVEYRHVFFFGVFFISKFKKVGRELLEVEKNLLTKVEDEFLRKATLDLEDFITNSFKCIFPLFFMGKHANSIRNFLLNIPSVFPEFVGLKDMAAKTTQYNSAYYVKALKKEVLSIN